MSRQKFCPRNFKRFSNSKYKKVPKNKAWDGEFGRENEYNHVLKNRRYNLKHNFGHGKEHARELFCLLNVLSYLMHGIQDMADEEYRKAGGALGGGMPFSGRCGMK
jgi:hypothetical protein